MYDCLVVPDAASLAADNTLYRLQFVTAHERREEEG